MITQICLVVATVLAAVHEQADLPTTYEYFTQGGIHAGLEATKEGFKLNGKPLQIISGSIHYFRVHPDQWRDRMRKLRAMGANCLETYIPWNLHEPQRDVYDFGNGTNDFSAFLDVKRYIQMAQEEDLLVWLRPGPFICAEWEFGGFPSWLQQDPNMRVREQYQPYLDRIDKYFRQLLARLVDLQFIKGGPIIGMQIENEYGSFRPSDKDHLRFLANLVKEIGFNATLLVTSDGPTRGDAGALIGELLHTVNFKNMPASNFEMLLAIQPDKPVMAMEFWTGWFDHWFEEHHTGPANNFGINLEGIIGPQFNGSVNFYMFTGGTNFGFMSGANGASGSPGIAFTVTSYDYDSPLSESGDYTAKYYRSMEAIEKYQNPKLARPPMLQETPKRAYPALKPTEYLSYEDILRQVPADAKFNMTSPSSMEDLPMNGGSGQSYGYLIHRNIATVRNGTVISAGPVKDFGLLLVDGKLQENSFANANVTDVSRYWINSVRNVKLEGIEDATHNVDILVENAGRVNNGIASNFKQKKGLPNGHITIDGKPVEGFEVYALEFKSSWVRSLTEFKTTQDITTVHAPLIARATFNVTEDGDTFIDMSGWQKGVVFINGFNLGRYWNVGPQRTLYVPGPLLKRGENTVTVFELLGAGSEIRFVEAAILS